MHFRKNILASALSLLIAIIFTITLTACPPAEQEETIKIGVIGPFTGEGASYGEAMQRGINLAFKENDKFELIFEDSQLSPKEGINALNKLVFQDKVKVVIGAAASSVTMAMAPIAEKNQVLLFSSISSTDDLKTAGDYIFRNVPRNEVQGLTAAKYIKEVLGLSKVAVYKKNDEYGTNLSKSFIYNFKQLGGEIVIEDTYQPGSQEFRTSINKFKQLNPEAMYVPGNYEEVARFLKQSYELGFNPVFVGGDGSYSPDLIRIAGEAAEGFQLTLMSVEKNDYYNNFRKIFVAKYNREPDVYDAYAYEAACFIIQAIDKVGYDSKAIIDYLVKTEFDSLTGKLTFDYYGEVNRLYGMERVQNGSFVSIK